MQELVESALEFVVPTAIALVLVLLGRRVFWALGGVAFAAAAVVITGVLLLPGALDIKTAQLYINIQFTDRASPTPFFIAGAIGGLFGILFTLRFPKAASAIVGFALGAFFLTIMYELYAIAWPEPVRRALLILVGTFVALFAIRQPEESMILLSTMIGADMILDVVLVDPNSPLSAFVWLLTMLVGIIYQTGDWRTEQRKRAERRATPTMSARAVS